MVLLSAAPQRAPIAMVVGNVCIYLFSLATLGGTSPSRLASNNGSCAFTVANHTSSVGMGFGVSMLKTQKCVSANVWCASWGMVCSSGIW